MKYLFSAPFFVVLLSSILSACSAKKQVPSDDFVLVPKSWSIAQATLSCSYGSKCDGSVGVLFRLEKAEENKIMLGRCTAWLVAPDVIATNSHCVNYQQQGSLMYTWFKLPDDSPLHGQYVPVRSVIQASPDSQDLSRIDYAYLQLDAPLSSAPLIAIDQSGIQPDELLDIHVVNKKASAQSRELSWQLDHFECRASSSSLFQDGPTFNPNYLYIVLVGVTAGRPCNSIPGNSGSPALSKKGDAKGIVYLGYAQGNEKDKLQQSMEGVGFKYRPASTASADISSKYNFVGLSNFACVPHFQDGTFSKDCRLKPQNSFVSFKPLSGTEKKQIFQQRVLHNQDKEVETSKINKNGIQWKSNLQVSFDSSKGEFVNIMQPLCFISSEWRVKPPEVEVKPSGNRYARNDDSWGYDSFAARDPFFKHPVQLFSSLDSSFVIRKPLKAFYDQNLEVHFEDSYSSGTRWRDYDFEYAFELSEQRELKTVVLKRQDRTYSYEESLGGLSSEIRLQPCVSE